MYIIDDTYFIKEITMPNSTEIDAYDSGGDDLQEQWIDQYSRELLQNALGTTLFNDLDSNVTAGVYVPGVTKWDNLVQGVEYTYQGIDYQWKGLIFTEGTFKGSVLAYYVYCKWLEYQLSRMSGVGEVKGNAANSMNVNSTQRYVNLWNTFYRAYQGDSDVSTNVYIKNGVPFFDYFGTNDTYVSLIEFLTHNETDYEDAQMTLYKPKNTFGL